MAEHPDKRYLDLAEKWLLGTITPAEMQEYAKWYNEIDPDAALEIPAGVAANAETYRVQLLKKINAKRRQEAGGPAKERRLYAFQRLGWVAAAFLILLGAGIYWVASRTSQGPPGYAGTKPAQNDLPPGGNKAILTLASGKTIILDSAANGTLARQGNSQVQKLANGHLSYLTTRNKIPLQPAYNTLSTPRGGQYRLTLPDGTGIWLNAASSVTYPTAFTGKERTVIVTGEVYFEVAPDKSRPFKVFVGSPKGMEVDVLGTHFNINAYRDEESVKTTLLDGSVNVHNRDGNGGTSSTLLFPGQQAEITIDDFLLRVTSNVNTEEVMAWKNGLFEFDNADIKTVMRQLARWYDVQVSYEGHITEDRFAGKLPMDASAEETLHILEKNQVHFRIENKKIIVMP